MTPPPSRSGKTLCAINGEGNSGELMTDRVKTVLVAVVVVAVE
jgi:hypothetical protein